MAVIDRFYPGPIAGWLCLCALVIGGWAATIVQMAPTVGPPGTVVSLSMEYLVGWPRVEFGGRIMDWSELKLLGLKPESREVPGEKLVWIEDKILQFRVPDLPPGQYKVIVHDDKGPPGDRGGAVLEKNAYVILPQCRPFVFRSN